MKFNVIANPLGPLGGIATGFSLKKDVVSGGVTTTQYNIQAFMPTAEGVSGGETLTGMALRDAIYDELVADGWVSYTPAPIENIAVSQIIQVESEPGVMVNSSETTTVMMHSIGIGALAVRVLTPPVPGLTAPSLAQNSLVIPLLTNPKGVQVWL